ncbi:hypothetical protein HOY82DRAFT_554131 [Tuber indicum]|nr:hypothetical protein HOY82DRAFT_554131 [Tuber indicum]
MLKPRQIIQCFIIQLVPQSTAMRMSFLSYRHFRLHTVKCDWRHRERRIIGTPSLLENWEAGMDGMGIRVPRTVQPKAPPPWAAFYSLPQGPRFLLSTFLYHIIAMEGVRGITPT